MGCIAFGLEEQRPRMNYVPLTETKAKGVSRRGLEPRGEARLKERGEGRWKAIVYTAVFVILVYAAFKIIPAYVSEYELTDKMQEQARFAVVNHYTDEQIRENIFKVVQDLDIPAKLEDIKVTTTQSGVRIGLDYRVPVDLLVYRTELHFTPTSENKAIM